MASVALTLANGRSVKEVRLLIRHISAISVYARAVEGP